MKPKGSINITKQHDIALQSMSFLLCTAWQNIHSQNPLSTALFDYCSTNSLLVIQQRVYSWCFNYSWCTRFCVLGSKKFNLQTVQTAELQTVQTVFRLFKIQRRNLLHLLKDYCVFFCHTGLTSHLVPCILSLSTFILLKLSTTTSSQNSLV